MPLACDSLQVVVQPLALQQEALTFVQCLGLSEVTLWFRQQLQLGLLNLGLQCLLHPVTLLASTGISPGAHRCLMRLLVDLFRLGS